MGKNEIFGKNRQKWTKNTTDLDGRWHFMGKWYVHELRIWNTAYMVYFPDPGQKMKKITIFGIFWSLLGTP